MLRQDELHGAASINEQVSTEVAKLAIDLDFAEGLLFMSVLHTGYSCSVQGCRNRFTDVVLTEL